MNFEKIQNTIEGKSGVYYIPSDVYAFARSQTTKTDQMPGVGRKNWPTLPDIYYRLTVEGARIIAAMDFDRKKKPDPKPEFPDVQTSEPWTVEARIKFDAKPHQDLRELKTRIDAGEFNVPTGNKGDIALTSVAVALMRLAISKRNEWMPLN